MSTAESLPLSHSLLNYYRARIEEFEAERALLIRKIEQCDVSHEVMHRTQWESRKKAEEIESLQRALNEAHLYVYDERQQLLQVYAENDEMRVQELEDRRKIKQLLALTKPVASEVTYMPGREPVRMRRFLGADADVEAADATDGAGAGTGASDENNKPMGSSTWSAAAESRKAPHVEAPPRAPHPGSAVPPGARKSGVRVLRTVYMPNDENDTLLLTIETLRAQVAERDQLLAETKAAYKEDRARLLEEAEVRRLHDAAKIDELLKANASLQALLTANTKEYLTFRHNAQMTQRLMKEDNEALLDANKRLRYEAQDANSRARLESKVAAKSASAAGKEVAAQLRATAKAAKAAAAKAEAARSADAEASSAKIKALTERVNMLSNELGRESKRWALEKEGYVNQVQQLKDELARSQATLWRVQAEAAGNGADDYELEVLNAALATAGRSKAVVGGLNRLKARVRAMEAAAADQ
ncbi:CCDC77 protein [Thecamonas trahens ATCC 50062]|uniref:CCDC77 protein n=1 Tax=Thecamonas trahens ATCC 50062 TaxID=461836 RepID=A0A0L0DUS8_THETB|nr:CCDC77 protein [Thecamonas trahens ATCC 50062]KNC55957.1 CCDC77 protein [Thecamonas trahens ATCC 50062]|eukprot:XP_013752698.1 CCDC77 protein [Thecamonas trahens ATCC 50062]